MLERRKEAMEHMHLTSHDPLLFRLTGTKMFGKEVDYERTDPTARPVLNERGQKLAGVLSY